MLLKTCVIFSALLYLHSNGDYVEIQELPGCTWNWYKWTTTNKNVTEIECEQQNRIPENLTRFVPAGQHVTNLRIMYSNITEILDNFLYKINLTQIESLDLFLNKISKIEDKAFRGGETILELDLSRNLLESLNPSVFRFLPNLERLFLGENKIKQFEANWSFPNRKLEVLLLNNNQIETLDWKLFSKLNNLEYLFLNGNKLKKINPSLFRKTLPKIFEMALYNNPWECDCQFKQMIDFLQSKARFYLKEDEENEETIYFTCQNANISVKSFHEINWGELEGYCVRDNDNGFDLMFPKWVLNRFKYNSSIWNAFLHSWNRLLWKDDFDNSEER